MEETEPIGTRKIVVLIHTDVCGPMNAASLAGSYYFVTFRDDFTGYGVVNFMKRKSETFNHLKNYVAKLENETGHSIITLRSANGGGYFSNESKAWLQIKGIRHESSAPKAPEQNGVTERCNRTKLVSSMHAPLI